MTTAESVTAAASPARPTADHPSARCPTCGAPPGQPCSPLNEYDRLPGGTHLARSIRRST